MCLTHGLIYLHCVGNKKGEKQEKWGKSRRSEGKGTVNLQKWFSGAKSQQFCHTSAGWTLNFLHAEWVRFRYTSCPCLGWIDAYSTVITPFLCFSFLAFSFPPFPVPFLPFLWDGKPGNSPLRWWNRQHSAISFRSDRTCIGGKPLSSSGLFEVWWTWTSWVWNLTIRLWFQNFSNGKGKFREFTGWTNLTAATWMCFCIAAWRWW